jgi:hypothetical protein
MKPKLLLCLALVLSGGFANVADTNSLGVVIIPSKTEVRIREPFSVAFRVENPTKTNQTVRVMGCSWDEEWQSSNTNIILAGWPCWANGPVDVEIHPGGAYTNEAPMCIYDLITNKEISFRMGFTSMGSKETYWSNEVKLHILPPDTWLHNGKFYRDRNHDGKIDWEVSGTTWMGHADFSSRYFTNSDKSVMATLEATGRGPDTYRVDTNYDGFYDLEYGAGGTNGQIQWTKNIHERVPVVGKDFVPVGKESWMDFWMPK